MSRDEITFRLMCRLLGAGLESAADAPGRDFDWAGLIRQANVHLVPGQLADGLNKAGLFDRLPEDLREYLALLRAASAERNQDIRKEIAAFVPALNDAGIEPILLKGTARLYEGGPIADTRMMVDIDALVPPGTEDAAWRAMTDVAGYRPVGEDDYSRAHQMIALGKPGAVATVEIHRAPGPQRTLLGVEEVFADANLIERDGARFAVMSATHRVLHEIFHGQIQDFHYWFARPRLRTLVDLHDIANGCAGPVDWDRASARFRDNGYGRVYDDTLALMILWLGTEVADRTPDARTRRYAARCLVHQRHGGGALKKKHRWIGWVGVNMLPKRLAYRHRLEEAGRVRRLIVMAGMQAAFIGKMATWPVRNLLRQRRGGPP